MTVREYLNLCWMAYIDMPPLFVSVLERGGAVPVAALADSILRMDAAGTLECVKLNEPAREAARQLMDSAAVVVDYINENDAGGFVAYVVQEGDETVIAMRGSESPGECVDTYVDWVDNVCEPFAGSVQLASIKRLAERYSNGMVLFVGHSKGGHNALAALAVSENPEARAVAFNGQGFARDALNEVQARRLRKRGVNYVVADDIVGALLYHPERRVYVAKRDGANAHMPEAFTFDENGKPVKTRRSPGSYAVEAATRLIEKRLPDYGRDAAGRLCRRAMGLYSG